jgi:spore maturation protein CgeB
MKVVVFAHSLLSDWNHGNAHFLRGVVVELASRGVRVEAYEPRDAWSVANLVQDHGENALERTHAAYPGLRIRRYDPSSLDLDEALDDADLVLVHEWNTCELVQRLGEHHMRSGRYVLLFHDTHHRSVSSPEEINRYDLSHYDGVLAFGEVVRQRYLEAGWAARVWTWHEAADIRVFRPHPEVVRDRDLVWIGNWGDDERTEELQTFLVQPAIRLGLSTTIHGVRYPEAALAQLRAAGIHHGGWIANYDAPLIYARHRVTVHVPRAPYVRTLIGVPTIRPFEALACGIPLVSAPWHDAEGLFRPGVDYLVAANGTEMERQLKRVLRDEALARELSDRGLETIRARHTCAHRVDHLLSICQEVRQNPTEESVCA